MIFKHKDDMKNWQFGNPVENVPQRKHIVVWDMQSFTYDSAQLKNIAQTR